MSFVKDVEYSRDYIANIVEVTADEAARAVVVKAGLVEAIVVAANGRHPSGKQYQNTLTPSTFVMHGEKDPRGKMLEDPKRAVRLFYSHGSNGSYRYEGHVRFTKVTDLGDPFREFVRCSE